MARAWEYQGILSRSDARQWARYWALLGWAVRLQRNTKGITIRSSKFHGGHYE